MDEVPDRGAGGQRALKLNAKVPANYPFEGLTARRLRPQNSTKRADWSDSAGPVRGSRSGHHRTFYFNFGRTPERGAKR